MKNTILVGIDGSSPSRAALVWSVTRAAATGAELFLVHVIDDEWGTVSHQMVEEIHRAASELIDAESDFARSLAPTVPVRSEILRGDPMIELAAVSAGAELVVVGTHKTGFLYGKAFGSRSLQLASTAHSPVAIIPERSLSTRHGIVVGVDDSSAGRAAVRFAAAEAERTNQELTLVRAWQLPALQAEKNALTVAHELQVHDAAERMMATALSLAKEKNATLVVRSRSIRRKPAEALLDASASADLLVIGSSRRHGPEQAALGPVSHDVLINLGGPTLVVHGEGASGEGPGLRTKAK